VAKQQTHKVQLLEDLSCSTSMWVVGKLHGMLQCQDSCELSNSAKTHVNCLTFLT